MCFHSKQSKSAQTIEVRFKAKFEHPHSFVPGIYNGFSFPKTPIITTEKTAIIQMYHWDCYLLGQKIQPLEKTR